MEALEIDPVAGGWKTIAVFGESSTQTDHSYYKICGIEGRAVQKKWETLFFLKKTDTTVDNMIILTKGNFHFRENSEANIPQDTTISFLWLNISSKWCSMALSY